MDKMHCPHCGKELTGFVRSLIISNLEAGSIDFASPCPSCGKMIRKEDIVKNQSHDKKKK